MFLAGAFSYKWLDFIASKYPLYSFTHTRSEQRIRGEAENQDSWMCK